MLQYSVKAEYFYLGELVDENPDMPKFQFEKEWEYLRLVGGLVWIFGVCATIEKGIFGPCTIRLVLGPLFLDIEIRSGD